MASDIRQPADDSHLHADPEPLAEKWQDIADQAWREMAGARYGSIERTECIRRYEEACRQVQYYRRLAARGERVPEF
jgi:hypothetical protein